ncbi:hypothetical protein Y1Q_0001087 [Alligator mississippiensis]|uniref:Uncharacterized protein n=1 Tax=Alligator mississippiensis TaxID=8496 RepID=A0A151NEK6_ALLMI|nr:hypothetical protein Y1Q_0001087 [Alligator mississippiensis]
MGDASEVSFILGEETKSCALCHQTNNMDIKHSLCTVCNSRAAVGGLEFGTLKYRRYHSLKNPPVAVLLGDLNGILHQEIN